MSRPLIRLGGLAACVLALVWVHAAASQVPPRLDPRYRPYPYQGAYPAPAPAPAPYQVPPQTAPRVMPKLEPVAETRLLMEALTHANFRGLERLLRERPADVQAWTFARGQALLIGESANLLMMRPPRGQGQAAWFERSMDLRKAATDVARAASSQDYPRARAGFVELANSCNRCHQAFRVSVEIVPFQDAVPPNKPGV